MQTGIKFTQFQVNKIFEDRGYILKDKYINNRQKLNVICPNKHEIIVQFRHFKDGHGCKICAGTQPFSTDEVRKILLEKGYILKCEYRNLNQKITVICPNGHEWTPILKNFLKGARCLYCHGHPKHNQEYVANVFAKYGYILKSDYVNSRQKVLAICPFGHEWTPTFADFQSGNRCLECSGQKPKTQLEVANIFSKNGYKLISVYSNSHSKLSVICSSGHDWITTLKDFNAENRCPKCKGTGTSYYETLLFDLIRGKIPHAKKLRDRRVKIKDKPYIKGFDIDIYIPELRKGIEFDGTYYHSFEYMRKSKNKILWTDEDIRNYHKIKDDWFYSKGIQIIHIKEEDWIKDKEKCIERCLTFLGLQ